MLARLLHSIAEIAGVVLFRFHPIPRIWALLVVGVNAAAIFFLQTRYAQASLAAVIIGLLIMGAIHARLGFVRLLGIGHVLWIPLLTWLASALPEIGGRTWLSGWLVSLIVVNALCLIVDGVDIARYLVGDRPPHYVWKRDQAR